MSTATSCDSPLRNFQISAAASPAAATLVCAAAATRNDDGNCGSSPVSVTASSADGSPPADVQMSLRVSRGVFPGLCMAATVCLPLKACRRADSDRIRSKLQLIVLTRFFSQTATRLLENASTEGVAMAALDPLTAGAVLLATAATDAVYVMFTSAVVARKRVPAATWSSVWYLLSSYAVISYTENWVYVAFAAVGSWLGAFITITYLHRPPGGPPIGAAPE